MRTSPTDEADSKLEVIVEENTDVCAAHPLAIITNIVNISSLVLVSIGISSRIIYL